MPRTNLFKSPHFLATISELSPASDRIWLLGSGLGLGFTLIAAFFFPYGSSPSGKFWAYASLLIRASLYLHAKDGLKNRGGWVLYRLFLMGLVAGLFELLVDWGLVHWVQNGKLVYLTGNDVVLLGSPIWMPLAWACVIVEMGYPALRLFGWLRGRCGDTSAKTGASLFVAMLAGLTVGAYEYLAFRAGWWKYEAAHAMIGKYCALFIPVGEFLMFLPILPIAASVLSEEEKPLGTAIRGGALFAACIALGYTLAYGILEYGRIP
ncbi:MAG: hypothetical protein K8R69_12085 [Deltaproteobacteria bacterium]|nr:hypothetical protein [Deltaproteobacteria bacterium]